MDWQPIETAPKDGTIIMAREHYTVMGSETIGSCQVKWCRNYWAKVQNGKTKGATSFLPNEWILLPQKAEAD
jgi:hypothetical protein